MSWLLLASDIVGLAVCFQLAFWLRLGRLIDWSNFSIYGLMLLTLMGLYLADTYHPDVQISGLWAPARTVLSNLAVIVLTGMSIYLIGPIPGDPIEGRGILLPGLGLFTIWAVLSRTWASKWALKHVSQSQWLFLGTSEEIIKLATDFMIRYPQATCIFWADGNEERELLSRHLFEYFSDLSQLAEFLHRPWSGVILGHHLQTGNKLLHQLMQLRLQGISIYTFPDFCERFMGKIPPSLLRDDWFAFSSGFGLLHHAFYARIKRFFDLVVSGVLLLLLLPLMVTVAILITLESRGSIFYSQLRTGQHQRPFRVYKFRSMVQNAESQGVRWAADKDPRITRVGKLIRLTRIDELPQLWNVLRGEMSLIGPRPERPEFDAELSMEIPYYSTRYLVAPGVTGWAQVLYPYGASVRDAYEKLSYDLYYIKNYSLFLDLAIALKTVRVVLLGKGR